MKRVELVVAECYANACIAREITRSLNIGVKLRHDVKMSRDKILKKIENLRGELGESSYLIAIIDYERGDMRKYIDLNFEFKEKNLFNGTVHIGVYKRDKRVIAVIFDPFIEAFLCKTTRRFCGDDEWGILKRGDINRVCRELLAVRVEEGIGVLSRALNSVLGDPPLFLTA